MLEYDPPDIEYCEIPAFLRKNDNLKLLGPQAGNFQRICKMLNLKYLWLDLNKNVIEIYGNLKKQEKTKKYLEKYMLNFYNKHCTKNSSHQSKRQKL